MRSIAGLTAVVLAGVLLVACGGGGSGSGGGESGSGSGSSDASFREYRFPAYPGATEFDSGQVLGQGGSEIVHAWYSTEDSVDDVLAFYHERLGDEGFDRESTGATWRLPAGGRPERTLSVEPAEGGDAAPPGVESPPASAETVIAVSRIDRP